MKIRELIEEDIFRNIREEVEQFVDDMLEDYLENLSPAEDKQIFDFVWGSVEFNSGEIAILDSPLIQRLRKIKHLGLASCVYCNADYSRFSHTIGVFFIANKMAQIIKKHDKNDDIGLDFTQIVRLAALFHDAGHMYFSHVSEYYFSQDITFSRHKEIKNIVVRFSEIANKTVPLHEILSVLIVNSEGVRRLLRKVFYSLEGIKIKNDRDDRDFDKITEYISCLIIGISNDIYLLPYHQIINGSVDADKCDYLSRDSHSTNVPVAVDIDRLINKLSVESDDVHGQDNEVWIDDSGSRAFYIPVLKSSAEEALNQLLMSRNIMFRSVYYHQKVRTAETMLRKIISDMNALGIKQTTNFTSILGTTDDFFNSNCSQIIEATNKLTNDNRCKLSGIMEDLKKLNYRFLLKRVCAISIENIIVGEEKRFVFTKEVFQLNNPVGMKKIEDSTREEYERICKLLGINTTGQERFIISEFPKYVPDNSKIDTLISYGNGNRKKASEVFQSEIWMGSKDSRNKEHYLLTNSQNRGFAFLALQKVLYKLYDAKLKEDASAYSKVRIENLRNDQRALQNKGYYDDSLFLISEIILGKYKERISALTSKFQTFEGKKGSVISDEKITEFLNQFLRYNSEKSYDGIILIDGIIRLLEQALFINRKQFDESMNKLLPQINNHTKYVVCPLGGEKDSAKHMMYYFNDISNNDCRLDIKSSLQECLDGDSDGIIFFDDGSYSGKQVVSIFQEYFGIQERETDEVHVKELNEEQKEKLKSKKITLTYICFNEQNKENLLKRLQDLGLNDVRIEFAYNMGTKCFDRNDIFSTEQQKELVKQCLNDIGFQLLNSTKCPGGEFKPKWNSDRVTSSALGYNNSQQVIFLKSSVPTYTIVAFWMEEGIYNGYKWIPLFERTDKMD